MVQYVLSTFATAIYNVTLHPLAKIPGPKLRAAFYFPSYWQIWTCNIASDTKKLHDEYGDTVRVDPHTVSFAMGIPGKVRPGYTHELLLAKKSRCCVDIYGQSLGKKPVPKDPDVYFSGNDGVADIICMYLEHAWDSSKVAHASC